MSAALLSTLPGDIPGLLRRGSPVLRLDRAGEQGTLHCQDQYGRWILAAGTEGDSGSARVGAPLLVLDLADATGRWHVALWLANQPISLLRAAADVGPVALGEVMTAALWGEAMTPEQIGILARLCLRLAGRSHV